MTMLSHPILVALEIGKTRTFASALDWPGWVRGGPDEAAALDALLAYGPRYQRAVRPARLNFQAPADVAAFEVSERLRGDSATDFGVPGIAPAFDSAPADREALNRLQRVLNACWKTFAGTVGAARGKRLRKGPRGGGRTVLRIMDHVVESHYGYLRRIYWREPHKKARDVSAALEAIRHAETQALAFASSDEMPAAGPRGGALWKPRYFVRRAAWHILDHVWEIEDRLTP